MNKFSFYFAGAALLALTACNNETVEPIMSETGGQNGYLMVNLRDVTSGTRATEDGGFADSPTASNENYVSSARFFFFDANGTYMAQASVWNGGNPNTNDKIEFDSNTMVVFKLVKEDEQPEYMLTLLNAPDFEAQARNLKEMSDAISNYAYDTVVDSDEAGNKTGLVMSTASYFHVVSQGGTEPANHNNAYYYATKLHKGNIITGNYKEGDDLSNVSNELEPVEVYVERLAAKVQLTCAGEPVKTLGGREGLFYPITYTVAGNLNNEGGDDAGLTDLYVEVLGWGLNGTAPESYTFKQLDKDWVGNTPWTNCNSSESFRHFWAKSRCYGFAKTETKNDFVNADGSYVLKYKDWKSLKLGNDGIGYCNENTNKPENLLEGTIVPSRVTCAVLKTRLLDKDGNALSGVRHKGVFYKEEAYERYVLHSTDLGTGERLNFWVADGQTSEPMKDEGNNLLTDENGNVVYKITDYYKQIDASYVSLAATGTGTGKVKVVGDVPEGTTIFYKTEKENEDGSKEKVFAAYKDKESADKAITEALGETQKDWVAEAYTGGSMYYNIPIEHKATTGRTINDEGYYGVVRNHWYQLTVTNILTIGRGVFNPGKDEDVTPGEPGEPIVPDDPENPQAYISAKLKVLSWKIVKQNVEL